MKELQSVARLKIHDGKLDEFKRLAAKCAELVRRKDTGTLQYELYFNGDNTECLTFERHRGSQALLDDQEDLGDTMAAILPNAPGPEKYAERLIQNGLSSSRIRPFRSTSPSSQINLTDEDVKERVADDSVVREIQLGLAALGIRSTDHNCAER